MERLREAAGELAYERSGRRGDPLVLVHGGWDDHRAWERVVPGLSSEFQLVAPDRRGHGESSVRGGGPAVQEDARDLARLLEATELYPAHVVAEDSGGAVALRLALDRPELVRSLALHEPTCVDLLPTRDSTVHDRLATIRAQVATGAAEAAVREYLRTFAGPHEQWGELEPARQERLLAAASAWAMELSDPEALRPDARALRGVSLPVLVTTGGKSPPVAAAVDAALLDLLPNGRGQTLEDGGHFVAWTDPDLYVGVLGTFLLERDVPST